MDLGRWSDLKKSFLFMFITPSKPRFGIGYARCIIFESTLYCTHAHLILSFIMIYKEFSNEKLQDFSPCIIHLFHVCLARIRTQRGRDNNTSYHFITLKLSIIDANYWQRLHYTSV